MSSYPKNDGTVGLRTRITLTVDDFVDALNNLPIADVKKILANFHSIDDVASATNWFRGESEANRIAFLTNIGVQTIKANKVTVNTLDVSSSFIKSIGHNNTENRLQIDFLNGDAHQYLNVPRSVYVELLENAANNDGSVGRLYNQSVKGKFDSIKL